MCEMCLKLTINTQEQSQLQARFSHCSHIITGSLKSLFNDNSSFQNLFFHTKFMNKFTDLVFPMLTGYNQNQLFPVSMGIYITLCSNVPIGKFKQACENHWALSSRNLRALSRQQKHQNKVLNVFKFNYKDSRTTSDAAVLMYLMSTHFTACSNVCIDDFECVIYFCS